MRDWFFAVPALLIAAASLLFLVAGRHHAPAANPCGTGAECECKPCRADCDRCVSPGR